MARRNRGRGILATGAALFLALVTAGCGQTIEGSAYPVGGASGESVNSDFDKLLRECDVVALEDIAEAVGEGSYPQGSFLGAVCMWDVQGAPGGNAMVTLNWYEIGSLVNEKQTADKLGYSSENVEVQGRRALQLRRPNDPDSCGVTASAADTGVVGWWINYRAGSSHPDPCAGARRLVELTLNLAR